MIPPPNMIEIRARRPQRNAVGEFGRNGDSMIVIDVIVEKRR